MNLRKRIARAADIVPPLGVAAFLAMAAIVAVIALSGLPARVVLVGGSFGVLIALAVTLHARSTRRHLRAIHAAARQGSRDRRRILTALDELKAIAEAAPRGASSRVQTPPSGTTLGRATKSPGEGDGKRAEKHPKVDSVTPGATVTSVPKESLAPSLSGPTWHIPLNPSEGPQSLIDLRGGEIATELPVRGGGKLALELDLRSPSDKPRTGAASVRIEPLDTHRKPVSRDAQHLTVDYAPGQKKVVSIALPPETKSVRLGVASSSGVENLRIVNRIRVHEADGASLSGRDARDIRVAMIADSFTYNSLKYECDAVSLYPATWREQFEEHAPDLFFCESAWAGTAPDRPWRGQIYASNAWSRENRQTLLEILEYCRRRGIPTAFWNKEDPSHYDDRRHDFTRTAILFDHVFTTDENCVDRYRLELGAGSVSVLPFAAQPRLYNPISNGAARLPGVVFAGSWYGYHPARSAAMRTIFDGILSSGQELVIYDRYFGDPDPNHIYPEEYAHLTRPAVPHAELASVYKSYRYGLNFNTETRSPTMFARRVFELAMSGTVVLTNYSRGVERFFGDQVVFLDRQTGRLEALDADDYERMRTAALENVLEHHTYGIRMAQVFDRVGIPYRKADNRIDAYAHVESTLDIARAESAFQSMGTLGATLTLVPGSSVAPQDVQRLYMEGATGSTAVVGREFLGAELARVRANRAALVLGSEPINVASLRRAALHLSYVEGGVAVTSAEPYTFGSVERTVHRLYAPSQVTEGTVLDEGRFVQAYRI